MMAMGDRFSLHPNSALCLELNKRRHYSQKHIGTMQHMKKIFICIFIYAFVMVLFILTRLIFVDSARNDTFYHEHAQTAVFRKPLKLSGSFDSPQEPWPYFNDYKSPIQSNTQDVRQPSELTCNTLVFNQTTNKDSVKSVPVRPLIELYGDPSDKRLRICRIHDVCVYHHENLEVNQGSKLFLELPYIWSQRTELLRQCNVNLNHVIVSTSDKIPPTHREQKDLIDFSYYVKESRKAKSKIPLDEAPLLKFQDVVKMNLVIRLINESRAKAQKLAMNRKRNIFSILSSENRKPMYSEEEYYDCITSCCSSTQCPATEDGKESLSPIYLSRYGYEKTQRSNGFTKIEDSGKIKVLMPTQDNGLHYADGKLQYRTDLPEITIDSGEAIIKVSLAGICNTDIEIVTQGYKGFSGVLGHEFVGTIHAIHCVEGCPCEFKKGDRVVSEINVLPLNLSSKDYHAKAHDSRRKAIGIFGHDGAFCEFVKTSIQNLYHVPYNISDSVAVFTEPLAAACQIMQQVHIRPADHVAIVGVGKLGTLIAQVLRCHGILNLTCMSRATSNTSVLESLGFSSVTDSQLLQSGKKFDLVIDSTGSSGGFNTALHLTKPCGKLLLKSTIGGMTNADLSYVVVNEISVIGSRCGPFHVALELLKNNRVDVTPLISKVFPLSAAEEAIKYAQEKDVKKVLLKCTSD